jgi:hypothetical protein
VATERAQKAALLINETKRTFWSLGFASAGAGVPKDRVSYDAHSQELKIPLSKDQWEKFVDSIRKKDANGNVNIWFLIFGA